MVNQNWYLIIYHLSRQNHLLDQVMIFSAQTLIYLAILFALIIGIYQRGKELKSLIIATVSGPIAFAIIQLLHLYYNEPRPFITLHTNPLIKISETYGSYPSEHTTIISIMFFSYFLAGSRYNLLYFFLLILIGFSRIYVGVHYPFDIIAGVLVGFISTTLAKIILAWIKKRLF